MNIRQKKLALATMSGVSLTVALAGCATDTNASPADAETVAPSTSATSTPSATSSAGGSATAEAGASSGSSTYTDGTYDAKGNYISPNGKEEVDVSVTLAGDVITAVTVTPEATNPTAIQYQTQFADGIAAVVVGKDIDEIDVSRVAGSSLTSGGFNEAIEAIKADAS
ncbi:hypothetical protein [Herbiconiux ginsengi]|uniref:FMN-binding domain-containing protein n=1 Tax=Herbiconiux ginsengi TaxID=381665 RepID=A0A1H3L7G0_9MICO|nr:hypothetical protein [Herbiconiux ginsengi]SDY60270.1 hypothetical protein SAMN05216554_0860 [Herbiconiux ginsengi]